MKLPHGKTKNKGKKAHCFQGANLTVANLEVVSIIAVSSFAEGSKHFLTSELDGIARDRPQASDDDVFDIFRFEALARLKNDASSKT